MTGPALEVRGLLVDYRTDSGWHRAVRDVSLSVAPGEVLGLVGESGSGKTTLGLTALGYLPPNARLVGGEVLVGGQPVLTLPKARLRRLRGAHVGFVPQNPTTALNPAMRVGAQLAETLRAHLTLTSAEIAVRCEELLAAVGLPDPKGALRRFPHQLSGGQQQRVAIAIAIICRPPLLVLDEPTTGLDVTVQHQIVALLRDLQTRLGLAMLWISHDLPLLSGVADRIAVMRQGELIETGPSAQLFARPKADYTRDLIAAIPDPDSGAPPRMVSATTLLAAQGLRIGYRRGWWPGSPAAVVVDDLTLDIAADETVALIGESGSGKSTTARAFCGLIAPLAGEVRLDGRPLAPRLAARDGADLRDIQYVFQNPDASLNPRATVGQSLLRPLAVFRDITGTEARDRAAMALAEVELPAELLDRYPSELSGGQRQRVAIARALLAEPRVLLCDEVLSALDVSVQARVLDLLVRLRGERQMAMLFITHDLAVVRRLADRVAVMQYGRIVENGPTESLFRDPQHACTQALLAAVRRLQRAA